MFTIKHPLIFLEIMWDQTGIGAEFNNGTYQSIVIHIKKHFHFRLDHAFVSLLKLYFEI